MSSYQFVTHVYPGRKWYRTRCPCWEALNAISKMIDCLLYCLHHLTCVLGRNQQWYRIKDTSVNESRLDVFE